MLLLRVRGLWQNDMEKPDAKETVHGAVKDIESAGGEALVVLVIALIAPMRCT